MEDEARLLQQQQFMVENNGDDIANANNLNNNAADMPDEAENLLKLKQQQNVLGGSHNSLLLNTQTLGLPQKMTPISFSSSDNEIEKGLK